MYTREITIYSGSFPSATGSKPISSSTFKQLARWEVDPDDATSVQFRIPSASFGGSNDRIALYISGSGKIGIGTKNPETALDIRDMAEDVSDRESDDIENRRENLLKLDRTANNISVKATALKTARTIGGVSFNGSANINLPGVNTTGNQDTSGTAAEATILENARTIGGVSFNGSANINLPGVNTSGNQATTGNAATATNLAGYTFATDRSNNLVITSADGRTTWTIAPD
jgi:hypothetical protein